VHRVWAVVAALVAAIALSACGGGNDELSESEYREQAQKISDTFDSQFAPAYEKAQSDDPDEALAGLEGVGESSDEASQELDKLQPPSEFQVVHDKLSDSLTTVGDRANVLEGAIATEDDAGAKEAQTPFAQSISDLERAGEEYDKKVGTE